MLPQRAQEEVEASYKMSNILEDKLVLYPWVYINVFLLFSLVAGIIRRELCIWSTNYRALPEYKRRNVVTYVIQFFVTSAAFVLQMYGSNGFLFGLANAVTPPKVNCMTIAIFITVTLYVWEVCYREKHSVTFLAHHALTLVLLQCTTASFYDTDNVVYLRYAMLFLFQATTEQMTFLALFCFRLDYWAHYHSLVFYMAGLQAFLLKSFAVAAAFVFFIQDSYVENRFEDDPTNWNMYWKVVFIPLLSALYGCQLRTCYILYSLGLRCDSKRDLPTEERGDPLDTTGHLSVWCVDETIYSMGRRWRTQIEDVPSTAQDHSVCDVIEEGEQDQEKDEEVAL